ncbi:MAG: spore coat protein CotJB [Ruminococcus sp.]|nr:spore coat protein CotJB [Ruminococcus sp.]
MNERRMLLNKIKKYDFTLKELNLYLDTHPDCRRALAMFRNYSRLRKECIEEFTKRFGPLTPEESTDQQQWAWISDPWPWERS